VSKVAFTVKMFGYYLTALGVALVLVPNLLLSLFGMPVTTDVWIRVLGVGVFNVGVFYVFAARCEAKPLFRASVYTRSLVFTAFLVFVALGLASPVLILFGVADLAGAVSTYVTSRGEHAAA
jgi:hypothetical protein